MERIIEEYGMTAIELLFCSMFVGLLYDILNMIWSMPL